MQRYLTSRAHRARHVRDLLRAQILSSQYSDRVLPSEDALAREFGVGRNVVREALALLVRENLVRRSQGVGTRPKAHIVVHELNSLRAIAEEGGVPEAATVHYRLLAWEPVPATPALAVALGVTETAEVLLWERLTVADEPIVLWTSHLPADLGLECPPAVTPSSGGGTFTYLEAHGVDIGHARVRTGATAADPAVAALLDVEPGAPVMVQHRHTITREGAVVEIATGYYRHDRTYLLNDYERSPRQRVPA